ncbi:hypothetical protein LVJ94_17230 [Pendulispora rubella]|uniref:Uncharacterized protein n=1 Tax=Pendulispora rubella TaxID=2741070 RepID=A0ABZ2LF16_9BACT
MTNIERVLGNGEKAMAITKGTVAGASTALGAWSLVATLGSASTGTAISSLSGAAAMNATLAWFGGGSLAAGGLGMTAGMAVVGGIVAVPAAAVVATTMHVKRARRLPTSRSKYPN